MFLAVNAALGKLNKFVSGKDAQGRGTELVVTSKTGEKQYANVPCR